LNNKTSRKFIKPHTPQWKRNLIILSRKNSARIGGAILLIIILTAIFAPFIATHDPYKMDIINRLTPPGEDFILGSDNMGRDIFSRIIYGTRITLQIGFIAVTIGLVIGLFFGLLTGYLGGVFDLVFMRFVDVLMAFPPFLLALAIVAVLGPSLTNAMIAVGIGGLPIFIRTIRSATMEAKVEDYVEASIAQGASTSRVLIKHILPNITSPIIILVTLRFPVAILSAAALSFIGLGAQPPTPEWGALLVGARAYIRAAPWVVNYPGLAIMITVLAFNLLGNALRDVFDPRVR